MKSARETGSTTARQPAGDGKVPKPDRWGESRKHSQPHRERWDWFFASLQAEKEV